MMVDIPPAVRLLPMDSEEPEFRGKSRDAVQQDFFLNKMPSVPHPGRFQYREKGLIAEPGTVVLFQFDKHIIASAVLVRRERYPEPAGPYNGALWFDPGSIRDRNSISRATPWWLGPLSTPGGGSKSKEKRLFIKGKRTCG